MWIQLADTLEDDSIKTIIRNFFAFGQGWFIAANALGLGITLVYTFGWTIKEHTQFFWISTPIAYAAFLWYNITHDGDAVDAVSDEVMIIVAFGLGLILGIGLSYYRSTNSVLFVLAVAGGYGGMLYLTNAHLGKNTMGLVISMTYALLGAAIATLAP